jgi:hypothetical protein
VGRIGGGHRCGELGALWEAAALGCCSSRPHCQAACPSAFVCLAPPPACPQGDCLDGAAELIVKQYKEVKRSDIYYIESKKKERYFEDAADDA